MEEWNHFLPGSGGICDPCVGKRTVERFFTRKFGKNLINVDLGSWFCQIVNITGGMVTYIYPGILVIA